MHRFRHIHVRLRGFFYLCLLVWGTVFAPRSAFAEDSNNALEHGDEKAAVDEATLSCTGASPLSPSETKRWSRILKESEKGINKGAASKRQLYWYNKGVALFKLQRYKEAQECFSKAESTLEAKKTSEIDTALQAQILYNLGTTLSCLEDYEFAIQILNRAKILKQNDNDIRENLLIAKKRLKAQTKHEAQSISMQSIQGLASIADLENQSSNLMADLEHLSADYAKSIAEFQQLTPVTELMADPEMAKLISSLEQSLQLLNKKQALGDQMKTLSETKLKPLAEKLTAQQKELDRVKQQIEVKRAQRKALEHEDEKKHAEKLLAEKSNKALAELFNKKSDWAEIHEDPQLIDQFHDKTFSDEKADVLTAPLFLKQISEYFKQNPEAIQQLRFLSYTVNPPADRMSVLTYTEHDPISARWRMDHATFNHDPDSFDALNSQTYNVIGNLSSKGLLIGSWSLFPLPKNQGYGVDPKSLRFENAQLKSYLVIKNNTGDYFLVVKKGLLDFSTKSRFGYQLRALKRDPSAQSPTDSDSKVKLPPALLSELDPLISNSKTIDEKEYTLASFLLSRAKYTSGNKTLDRFIVGEPLAWSAQKKVEQMTHLFEQDSAVPAELKGMGADCDVWAEYYALLARHYGIPTRLAIGYANFEQNLELKIENLHGWNRVWNESSQAWVDLDVTPSKQGPREGEQKDLLALAEKEKLVQNAQHDLEPAQNQEKELNSQLSQIADEQKQKEAELNLVKNKPQQQNTNVAIPDPKDYKLVQLLKFREKLIDQELAWSEHLESLVKKLTESSKNKETLPAKLERETKNLDLFVKGTLNTIASQVQSLESSHVDAEIKREVYLHFLALLEHLIETQSLGDEVSQAKQIFAQLKKEVEALPAADSKIEKIVTQNEKAKIIATPQHWALQMSDQFGHRALKEYSGKYKLNDQLLPNEAYIASDGKHWNAGPTWAWKVFISDNMPPLKNVLSVHRYNGGNNQEYVATRDFEGNWSLAKWDDHPDFLKIGTEDPIAYVGKKGLYFLIPGYSTQSHLFQLKPHKIETLLKPQAEINSFPKKLDEKRYFSYQDTSDHQFYKFDLENPKAPPLVQSTPFTTETSFLQPSRAALPIFYRSRVVDDCHTQCNILLGGTPTTVSINGTPVYWNPFDFEEHLFANKSIISFWPNETSHPPHDCPPNTINVKPRIFYKISEDGSLSPLPFPRFLEDKFFSDFKDIEIPNANPADWKFVYNNRLDSTLEIYRKGRLIQKMTCFSKVPSVIPDEDFNYTISNDDKIPGQTFKRQVFWNGVSVSKDDGYTDAYSRPGYKINKSAPLLPAQTIEHIEDLRYKMPETNELEYSREVTKLLNSGKALRPAQAAYIIQNYLYFRHKDQAHLDVGTQAIERFIVQSLEKIPTLPLSRTQRVEALVMALNDPSLTKTWKLQDFEKFSDLLKKEGLDEGLLGRMAEGQAGGRIATDDLDGLNQLRVKAKQPPDTAEIAESKDVKKAKKQLRDFLLSPQ